MVVFLGTLVLIASGLLTMLSLFCKHLTIPRRQEVWLYTSIPHVSLKNVMKILLDEAFRVRGARCLKRGKCFRSNDDKSEINITK